MREVWDRIEGRLREVAPHVLDRLPTGATEDAVAAAEARLGVRLPGDVRASFRVHDGSGGAEPLPGWEWYSLAAIIDTWEENGELLDGGDFDGCTSQTARSAPTTGTSGGCRSRPTAGRRPVRGPRPGPRRAARAGDRLEPRDRRPTGSGRGLPGVPGVGRRGVGERSGPVRPDRIAPPVSIRLCCLSSGCRWCEVILDARHGPPPTSPPSATRGRLGGRLAAVLLLRGSAQR